MVFVPGSIAEEYLKGQRKIIPENKGFIPGSIAEEYLKKRETTIPEGGGFVPGSIAKKYPIRTTGLDTSEKLYNLAVQSGLQKRADDILSQKGEEMDRIFSGGFISDVFDFLNALQYGVVGLLKGKGFAEGIRTRESFAKKEDLGKYGLPGTIAGIALDIAVDPLTYIPPIAVAKWFGKIPGVAKIVKGVSETAKASKLGRYLASRFIYRFGQDPLYVLADERRIKNIAEGFRNIREVISPITGIELATRKKFLTLDKTGHLIRKPLSEVSKLLSGEELEVVKNAYRAMDEHSLEAAKLGLVSGKTVEENLGKYIRNAYLEFEIPKEKKGFFGFMRRGVRREYAKPRIPEMTPELAEKLGRIEDPAYLLFKGMLDLRKDIENTKLFKLVNKKFSVDTPLEGFKQLPKSERLVELAGKYVPQPIFDSIQEITRIKSPWEKNLNKVVAGFKYGKVILNPPTHARNIISNTLLNWWKLGIGPWRLDKYAKGIKSLVTKDEFYQRAVKQGYDIAAYAAQEINDLLLGPEGLTIGKKIGKDWRNLVRKIANIYQGEEGVAKLTAFRHFIERGMTDEDAWRLAVKGTFDYSEVTPFVRRLRESIFGLPFITFTFKATPIVAETALKYPRRISSIGKIKNAIEQMADIKTTEKERASEPQWIKEGFYVKLPIKDKYGRSAYLDLTYIIPFGDLISGEYWEKRISRETGLPEGIPMALTRKSPFINLIRELASNQDFYGDKIFKEGDPQEEQLKDITRHIAKFYLPPLIGDQLPSGYRVVGKQAGQRRRGWFGMQKEPTPEQERTLMQYLLRQVGLKIQPIDADIQETYMEWEKKKALETLLEEAGILRKFERPYIPK